MWLHWFRLGRFVSVAVYCIGFRRGRRCVVLFFRSSRDTQFAQLLTHVIVDCCCKGMESCIWTRNTWSAHQTEHPTSHQGNSVRQASPADMSINVKSIHRSMSGHFGGRYSTLSCLPVGSFCLLDVALSGAKPCLPYTPISQFGANMTAFMLRAFQGTVVWLTQYFTLPLLSGRSLPYTEYMDHIRYTIQFPLPLPSAPEVLVPGWPWLRTCRSGPTEWSGLRMLWCGVELRHQSCSPLSVHPHKSDTGDEHGLGTGTLRCWECALRPPDQQPRPQSHRVGRTGPVLQGRFDDERHPPTHTRATATDDDKDPKPRHWISTGAPQGLFPRDNRVHVRRVRHRCRCATVWAPHAASRRQASASTSDISWIQPEDQRGAGTRATSLIWDAKEHARVFTSLLPLLAETIRSYEAANAGDIIIFATPGISAGVADPAVCTSA